MNVIQQRVTELVDPRVEIELLADGFVFTEGPVWSFRDSHLTFSDIPADTMYRSDEREGVRAYRKPSNFSNGLAYHADGALIACEHRTRRVTRETPSGVQTIADTYKGSRLNAPNDVVLRESVTSRYVPRNVPPKYSNGMPAKLKLRDDQVKGIRRRVRAGERVIDLADEYGVNRKTIRRRLDTLERAETERAERIAAKRLRTQAARERRKLLDRERAAGLSASDRLNADSGSQAGGRLPREGARVHDPYREWLDTRKNLSGRALAEASGLVRVRNPEGTVRKWCERPEVDALLEAGWQLA